MRLESHEGCEALTGTVVESTLSASDARARRYGDGRAIWTPADLPDRVFRLKSGRVQILVVNADGREDLYRSIEPGEVFGEMCFCGYRHEPHGSEARSIGPSEVWATSYTEFRKHLASDRS